MDVGSILAVRIAQVHLHIYASASPWHARLPAHTMPSFFTKHDQPDTPSSASRPLSPAIVMSGPEVGQEREIVEGIDGAFKAIDDASRSDEKYDHSKSLKVLNVTGMFSSCMISLTLLRKAYRQHAF